MNDLILLIRTSRPLSWIAAVLLFLTGFYVSGAAFSMQSLLNVQLVLLLSLIIFGINDVYDYDADVKSKRKHSLIEGYAIPKEKRAFVKKSCALAAAILIIFSLATRNATNIFTTAFLVFLAYAYSAPPLRLKEKPVLDSLSNAVIVMALLMLGFSYGGAFLEFPIKLVYASLGAAAIHAIGALMDYTSDKKAKVTTIATFFGKRFSALFAVAVLIVIILFAGIKSTPLNAYLWATLALTCVSFLFPSEKLARKIVGLSLFGFIVSIILFIYQQFFK